MFSVLPTALQDSFLANIIIFLFILGIIAYILRFSRTVLEEIVMTILRWISLILRRFFDVIIAAIREASAIFCFLFDNLRPWKKLLMASIVMESQDEEIRLNAFSYIFPKKRPASEMLQHEKTLYKLIKEKRDSRFGGEMGMFVKQKLSHNEVDSEKKDLN